MRLRWGVLGTARIAVDAVVPAMQRSTTSSMVALASRDGEHARRVAARLGVPRSYGSYQQLLDDPDIDAVYVPLPNTMHARWAAKAAEAGKHVLCEKPLTTTAAEAEWLLGVRDRTGVRIQEAFMVRTHPQWVHAQSLVERGELGTVRAIQGFFSFDVTDPQDIVNQLGLGGGGLLDIGCYPVFLSRLLTGQEPTHVVATIEIDPLTGVDRLGSAVLCFPGVQASFTYSTQLVAHERMQIFGTLASLHVERPFTPPRDRPSRLVLARAGSASEQTEVVQVPACDQYTVAVDAFVEALREARPQPVSLEDSVSNARVLDAVRRSSVSGQLEAVVAA
jgi:predicted dehydrogenase